MSRKRNAFLVAILGLMVAYYFAGYTLPVYHYESADREYSDIEVPWKGRDLESVEKYFDEYRKRTNNPTLKLYRTSSRIWSAPNLWIDNLTNRRWSLPYMPPSPRPKRVLQIDNALAGSPMGKTP